MSYSDLAPGTIMQILLVIEIHTSVTLIIEGGDRYE
jgi:hypothetical protein